MDDFLPSSIRSIAFVLLVTRTYVTIKRRSVRKLDFRDLQRAACEDAKLRFTLIIFILCDLLRMLSRLSTLRIPLQIPSAKSPRYSDSLRPFATLNVRRTPSHTKMEDRDPAAINAPPSMDQTVRHEGKIYTTIKEGNAYILVPPNARTSVNPTAKAKADEEQKVFYNPIQQFNRDLSVLAIKSYGEDLCRRKTIARDAKKKKEEGKRERKKQRKAEHGSDAVRQRSSAIENGTSELAEAQVGQDALSRKRKRTDEGEGDVEGHANKAQKGGGPVEGEDRSATLPSVGDVVNGADIVASSEQLGDGAAAASGALPSDGVNGAADTASGAGADTSTKAPEPHLKSWQPSFRILDALSATGLRALRYATEIPAATSIVANDRDRGATAAIALNVQHNDLASKISTSTGDAMGHMYAAAFPPPTSHGPSHVSGKYDVIDLDPYGTAAPFIDAALQALNDEGMLCVTCTDSGVFASCGYSEKTFSLYGGMPIKGTHAHEGGLRLILHSIASSAAKYGIAIEPLLSLSIDFYARVFVRVRKSPADVKFTAGKTMLVYECDVGCGAWSTQLIGRHQRHGKNDSNWKYHISVAPTSDKLCEHCGSKMHIAGPMWGGPLHNPAFVEKVLEDAQTADKEVYHTLPRIEGMLDTALSELLVLPEAVPTPASHTSSETDPKPDQACILPTPPHVVDHHPFYFNPSALCKVIKAVAPPEAAIRGALRHLGYIATRSHAKAGSIKTDAPFAVIWEVLREWVRQRSPVKMENLREGGPGRTILAKTRSVDPAPSNGEGPTAADAGSGDSTQAADARAANDDAPMTDAQSADTPTITVNANDAPTAPQPATKPEPGRPLDVSKLEIVFDEKLGREPDRPGQQGKKRLVRYQQNPRENWGPMARAKGKA